MRLVTSKMLLIAFTVGLVCTSIDAQTELHSVWQGDTGGTSYDIEVSGGLAFVANNDGVAIYDVARPSQPRLTSFLAVGGVLRLCIVGSTLYAAAPERGLMIFDVGDPSNPRQIGSYGRDVVDVLVHDNTAYLRIMNGGDTEIVDVSDPGRPVELARMWPIRGAAACGAVLGNVHVWDVAAGQVILQAAGGSIRDLSGKPVGLSNYLEGEKIDRVLVAAAKGQHKEIISTLEAR